MLQALHDADQQDESGNWSLNKMSATVSMQLQAECT